MNSFAVLKTRIVLLAALLSFLPVSEAQFLDSSAGLGAGLVKLFGDTKAFSARADVRVYTNRIETFRAPMNFALLDGNMRMDFDLGTIQGKAVQPTVIKMMTQAGLNQVASIVRMDKRIIHLVFNRAQSYIDMEIPKEEAAAAEGNVQVTRTPLGKETIDKHPCTKNKVVVKNAKGAAVLEATAWNADDMKEFPLQLLIQGRDGTTLIRFSQVQQARPPASQFVPPPKFAKYEDQGALFLAASHKTFAPVTRTAAPPASATPNRSVASQNSTVPPAAKGAVQKPAIPSGKTNAAQTKPRPVKK